MDMDIDYKKLREITDDTIDEYMIEYREQQMNKEEIKEECWKCKFLEWSGTVENPIATEVVEIGTVKGNWVYLQNGKKKKTTEREFQFIKKLD